MKDKRCMSYRRHVIYVDGRNIYSVALKRDGTDEYFNTLRAAMDAIDSHIKGREKKK